MATPQQLLANAQGRLGRRPNMQGTRGGPARGGVAARPLTPPAGMTAKGSASANPPGTATPLGEDPTVGGGKGGAALPGFKPNPSPLGAAQGQLQGAGANLGRMGAPGGDVPPAWKRLQEMGIEGQGSPAANAAKLKEMMATKLGGPASGPIMADTAPPPGNVGPLPPGADLGRIGGMQVKPLDGMPADGPPTLNAFPGFKPRPGGLSAAGGGAVERPMPGLIPNEAPGAPAGGGFGELGRVGAGLRRPRLQPDMATY